MYNWSINNIEDFWSSVWDDASIVYSQKYSNIVDDLNKMPGAKWFQNSKLVDEKDINILINLANGSLGKALQVINNENFFNIYKEGEKIINNMANINKDEINNFFSLFDKNLEVDDFLKVIQIIIIQNIKNSFNENKNMDKKSVNAYISLFFEINKKLDKFKSFDLHDAQILETIKFIFIKHSENF